MDDHVIRITMPPDDAVAGSAKIVDGVARSERAATNAQKAFRGLGDVFRTIGAYEQQVARDAARAGQAVDTLTSSFAGMAQVMRGEALQRTAQGFRSVADAIRLEQQMLRQIHGDLEQYKLDLAAIDSLHRRGEISARQHGLAIAASRSRNGIASPADVVSLPSAARGGAVAGGSSLTGALPAIAAGAYAAKSVLDLSDSYTSLQNRLRQVAGSQENLNELMKRTRSVADATRSDWSATAESFVRLTNATKQMGLSQDRALKITETLNMALQSSGASSSEAAAGTLQLMQALASGALQGDEFRSIAEQLPDLLDIFAKEMGVSRGELKKLGSEGKITADIVVRSLESASGTIRDKFAKSTATASQQWTVLKNQLTETANNFVTNSGAMETLSTVTSGLSTALNVAGKAMGALKTVTGALGDAFTFIVSPGKLLTDAIGDLVSGDGAVSRLTADIGAFVNAANPTADAIKRITGELGAMHARLSSGSGVITSVEDFTAKMSKLHGELSKKFGAAGTMGWLLSGGAVADAAGRVGNAVKDPWGNDFSKWADDFKNQKDALDRINKPMQDYQHGLEVAADLYAKGSITGAQYTDEVKRLELAYDRADKKASGFVKTLKGNREEIERLRLTLFEKGISKPGSNNAQWEIEKAWRDRDVDIALKMDALENMRPDEPDLGADLAAFDRRHPGWKPGGANKRDRLTSMWFSELERMQAEGAQVSASLSDGFGEIGESIARMAASGAQSFDQMTASMAASLLGLFASQGLQALGSLFGFGSTGAIGAGAGVALSSSGVPGFASGGIIPPSGSGSGDTRFLALRTRPDETIHINTPSQEAAYRMGGGGPQTFNVHVTDPNSTRRLEVGGRATILRVVTEAFPWLRSPSGRV